MKTTLTKEIENALLYYTKADKAGTYGGYEICFGNGLGNEYCDYVTVTSKDEIRCYEIKVSKKDYESKCKWSFYGDYNYVVMPTELVMLLRYRVPFGIGILAYDNGKFKTFRKAKKKIVPLHQRVMVLHCMVRSLSRLTVDNVKRKCEKMAQEESTKKPNISKDEIRTSALENHERKTKTTKQIRNG